MSIWPLFRTVILGMGFIAMNPVFVENTHAQEDHIEGSLGAHEHASGKAGLALDNGGLAFELELAAIDAVGFEHQPANQEESTKIHTVINRLKKPETLLAFDHRADCTAKKIHIDSSLLEGDGDLSDEHRQENQQEHVNKHSDLEIEYEFVCQSPEYLKSITLTAFQSFPTLQHVELIWITETGQGAIELTPSQPVIQLTQ